MNPEKAVNHGDHGEHGVISKCYAGLVYRLLGDANNFHNILFFFVLSVFSVVQMHFSLYRYLRKTQPEYQP